MFKWAAAEELLPPSIHQALAAVDGLREGRSAAREKPPVGPVPDDRVDATLPHLPPVVADMVRVQRLTGMRPQELVGMRPGDIDRSDPECWAYRPGRHKTEHHGRERLVFLGPRARTILAPYLLACADGPLFSPRRSEARRNAERREARRTPMAPAHTARKRKERPARVPGDSYTRDSYRRAIARACDAAFPHPTLSTLPDGELTPEQRAELDAWRKARRWHPNQLRHTAATEIRRHFGLEASQAVLGHAELGVTQVYAERDLARAREVMRQVG
jgi:integrase